MKSRLKKIAIMSPDMFQGQLDQISGQGRNILKSIEEYKFFVEQASRVVKNDAKLTEVIINKKKNLDQAAQQIYDVVFEIENVDVIALYKEQQDSIEENADTSLAPTPDQEPKKDPKEEAAKEEELDEELDLDEEDPKVKDKGEDNSDEKDKKEDKKEDK